MEVQIQVNRRPAETRFRPRFLHWVFLFSCRWYPENIRRGTVSRRALQNPSSFGQRLCGSGGERDAGQIRFEQGGSVAVVFSASDTDARRKRRGVRAGRRRVPALHTHERAQHEWVPIFRSDFGFYLGVMGPGRQKICGSSFVFASASAALR